MISFRRIGPYSRIPVRGSDGAAGWDLYSAIEVELSPGMPTLISTHIEARIPANHCALILPRSGNSLRNFLTVCNSPGLIDEDYSGEWKVIVAWNPPPNFSDTTFKVPIGFKIAQVVLMKYEFQDWKEVPVLPETKRGQNGFGSTG